MLENIENFPVKLCHSNMKKCIHNNIQHTNRTFSIAIPSRCIQYSERPKFTISGYINKNIKIVSVIYRYALRYPFNNLNQQKHRSELTLAISISSLFATNLKLRWFPMAYWDKLIEISYLNWEYDANYINIHFKSSFLYNFTNAFVTPN